MAILIALALVAQAFSGSPVLKQSQVVLNCPLGAGVGTGDDNLTCTGGEVVTLTRTTVSIACPRTALEDTAVWEESAGTPCFIDGYGMYVSPGLTNAIIRSEAFDNASWVDVGTPVRAAGVGDSPLNDVDADTLADSIEDNDGAAQEGIGQQYATDTTSLQAVSVWARVTSGTLAFTICVLTGTDTCNTGNGCCANQSATTTWTRFNTTATTGATNQTKNLRIVVGNDGTGATTGVLWLWGAQARVGSAEAAALIPYCRSTGASATACNAETYSVAVHDFPWVSGAFSADTRPYWNALSNSYTPNQLTWFDAFTAATTNVRTLRFVASDERTYFVNWNGSGGSTSMSAALTWAKGVSNTAFAAWGGSDRSLGQNFTVGVRDVDATMPVSAPTTVNIGMGNSSKLDACLSNLRFYRVPQTYMR